MTMTFATAVARDAAPSMDRGYTRTENGMRSLKSTLSASVDLFGGLTRGKNLTGAFEAAFQENPDVAMRIAQYARDVRGGQGERKIFRDFMLHLERTRPDVLTDSNILKNVAEIGRFDDLLIFNTHEVKAKAYAIVAKALSEGNGLAAKWMPRKGAIAVELRNFMELSPKQYRKLLVRLTNVVETKMCAREFDSINFSHVPSVAMSRYMTAFHKRAPYAFTAYKEALKRGDKSVKVNASAVYPYDIVRMVRPRYSYYSSPVAHDPVVANEMWKALPDYMNDVAVLPMVDVSGSMDTPVAGTQVTCMDVAISLGLYCSERTKNAAFKDLFLTFSANPEFVKVTGTLSERVSKMSNAQWDMNTNLHAAFDKVLSVAVRNNVPESEMPAVLLILSDMQFDRCTRFDDTALQMMRRKYEAAGYTMPNIVFWNLNDRGGDKPVRFGENGVALVSGFSPAIMKSVLASDLDKFTPESVMLKALMVDRYNW
jgi:hypothetical protein